jgi:hypothetical protein
VKDDVRGNINVNVMKSIGRMKENTSLFRAYLNKGKGLHQSGIPRASRRTVNRGISPSGPKPNVQRRPQASNPYAK